MKNNKKLILRITYLLTSMTLGYFVIKAVAVDNVLNQLGVRIVEAEKQLQEEEATLQMLEDEQTNMDTLEYIEKVAREELGMISEGNIVFKKKE